jgi:hypothetical protein
MEAGQFHAERSHLLGIVYVSCPAFRVAVYNLVLLCPY